MGGEEELTKAEKSTCESETTFIWTIFWFEVLLKYEELHFSFYSQTKAMPIPSCGWKKAIQSSKTLLNDCAWLGQVEIEEDTTYPK